VWLGSAAQATVRVPIGTGVTPPGARYHPALIAQAWMFFQERLRELEQLGPTVIVLQNNSAADPLGAIELLGRDVLPALRSARVP
jgi:hypothetical protein